LKEQLRGILWIGLFFSIVVAVVDFFLARIPVLNWAALTVSFAFLAIFVLDLVVKLVPRSRPAVPPPSEWHEDELQRLARLVGNALVKHDPESLSVLQGRLRSVTLTTIAERASLAETQIVQLAEHDAAALQEITEDKLISDLIACPASVRVDDPQTIEKVLSKLES